MQRYALATLSAGNITALDEQMRYLSCTRSS